MVNETVMFPYLGWLMNIIYVQLLCHKLHISSTPKGIHIYNDIARS
jgi:hypothetical protein